MIRNRIFVVISLLFIQRKGGLIPLPAEIPSSTASTRWLRKSCDGISSIDGCWYESAYHFFRPTLFWWRAFSCCPNPDPLRDGNIRLRMVSCCEIHQSLADALPSNIASMDDGPVSEKISNQGPSSTAADALWVDIRFRETNEVLHLVGPQYYSSFALYVHTFFDMVLMRRYSAGEKEISICRVMILSSIHVRLYANFHPHKSSNSHVTSYKAKREKQIRTRFFIFTCVENGGSLQTADLISGKWNV